MAFALVIAVWVKSHVTGNENVDPDATVVGNDEFEHPKVARLVVHPLIVTDVLAVQVI